jgi:Flp pilus assembly protein TadG
MVVLFGLCTLAVDYGHVQLVKTELQRTADATARGYMSYYNVYGASYADSVGPQLFTAANNPVDDNSGVAPTVTVTWGYWDAATKSFGTTNSGTGAMSVRVVATRSVANGNPIRLFWGTFLGVSACDVTATATAISSGGQSGHVTVSGTANPYLAGMPAGVSNMYGDNGSNATPYEVTSIPVTPGTYVSFPLVSGSTNVLPGYVANSGPGGLTNIPVHHGQNYNYTINTPGPENGIADAVMYESAFMGLFLGPGAPDTTPTPATVDWTKPGVIDQPTYPNIQLKQPFMVGDGTTTGGVVQRFLVPPGATRMFVGVWDGVGYYNNHGAVTAKIDVTPGVTLVQ